MNYTIVGLFPSHENIENVSAGLQESGITKQSVLLYNSSKKQPHAVRANLLERLFMETTPQFFPDNDELITSVEVRNAEEFNAVKKSFKQNKAVKIYEFKDMTLDEARDLSHIRKIVQVRAKSHIYKMPEFSLPANALNEL